MPQRIVWLSLKGVSSDDSKDTGSPQPKSATPTEVVTEVFVTTTEQLETVADVLSDGTAPSTEYHTPIEEEKKHMISDDLFSPSVIEPFKASMPMGMAMRPLQVGDFCKGYIELLAQLTAVGEISAEQFEKRFRELQSIKPFAYYTVVIEDEGFKKIVASATLVLEWKFIHECGARGRIEDVVVDSLYRGKSLGRLLNECLVKLGTHLGVYKMSLECKTKLIPYYEKFGFHLDDDNNFLVQRFDQQ